MRIVRGAFLVAYASIALLFFVCAMSLLAFAGLELWTGIDPGATLPLRSRFDAVLEAIALLTIGVAALELGQTVLEEEVQRAAHMSAPTRVRRFLSRFFVVVVVALSVETLVAVFRFAHEDPSHLPQAAFVGFAAAALLAAWGVFVRLNRSAEELEPEAMAQAKSEDPGLEADRPAGRGG